MPVSKRPNFSLPVSLLRDGRGKHREWLVEAVLEAMFLT